MDKVIVFGEIKIGEKGCVHQQDFAQAIGAQRLTTLPKEGEVQVIVGKLLKDRKPAQLVAAEKRGLPIATVEDVLHDTARVNLKAILLTKPKLETYEKAAFEALTTAGDGGTVPDMPAKAATQVLADVFPMPKKRGQKGKKAKTA